MRSRDESSAPLGARSEVPDCWPRHRAGPLGRLLVQAVQLQLGLHTPWFENVASVAITLEDGVMVDRAPGQATARSGHIVDVSEARSLPGTVDNSNTAPLTWSVRWASPCSAAPSTLSAAWLNAASVAESDDCASRAADGSAASGVMRQSRAGTADGSPEDPTREWHAANCHCRGSVCSCHPLLVGCIVVRSATSAVGNCVNACTRRLAGCTHKFRAPACPSCGGLPRCVADLPAHSAANSESSICGAC